MKGGRLSEGLAAAARVRRAELIALADDVAEHAPVEVLDAPAAGSIMLELESSVGSFCFAEVVVTTARVRVDDRNGWGCVLGWDAEGALASALCDAVADERAARVARSALEDEARAREARLRAVAGTKV